MPGFPCRLCQYDNHMCVIKFKISASQAIGFVIWPWLLYIWLCHAFLCYIIVGSWHFMMPFPQGFKITSRHLCRQVSEFNDRELAGLGASFVLNYMDDVLRRLVIRQAVHS